MSFASSVAAGALALAALAGAHAAPLSSGDWTPFDVDELTATSGGLEWIDIADGSPLRFEFTVPAGSYATLTIVDGGFAGDRFALYRGAQWVQTTSPATDSYPDSVGLDFDVALATPAFSRAVLVLGAGHYDFGGRLYQSAMAEGSPLNATVGGVRLEVSPVPEPSQYGMALAGLLAIGAVVRRRIR